jgi:hypothetical protein
MVHYNYKSQIIKVEKNHIFQTFFNLEILKICICVTQII